MELPLVCRSMLMTSALKPEHYAAATEAGADISILDLEDSVPPEDKEAARRSAIPFFAAQPDDGASRGMRINSIRSPEGLRDVLALQAGPGTPELLLVPKVESAEELVILAQLLDGRLESVGFLATIETARGLCAVDEIARAVPRVRALVFGSADFCASVGTTMAWEHLLYARSRILVAAAAAGVSTIDAPWFDLADEEGLRDEVQRSSQLGFSGKAAIHPRQVPQLNRGFVPPAAAVAQAREIIARSERSGGQIVTLGGQMIGPPFVKKARRLLAIGGQLQARHPPDEPEGSS